MELNNYKDLIKDRVPEYYQTNCELMEYLEVCGELFGELATAVRSIDDLNDYRHVPESRLAILARKFAFNPPRGIPVSMMRGIIRDIVSIYSTSGTEQALFWVFRLLGWNVRTEYAWLLNPERYDPAIKNIFPELYDANGLESDLTYENSVLVPIGGDYTLGVENQTYKENPEFIFAGFLKIGRNQLTYGGGDSVSDPFSPTNPPVVTTDFNKIAYQNFVFGEERTEEKGTFFYGRTPFSTYDNLRQLRILGEEYPSNAPRYTSVVMKTPYVMVSVDESDYAAFTEPYYVDGEEYNYTESEAYTIADTIINYFMTDTTRPSPVKIIITTGHAIGSEVFYISESMSDSAVAEPEDLGSDRISSLYDYIQQEYEAAPDDHSDTITLDGDITEDFDSTLSDVNSSNTMTSTETEGTTFSVDSTGNYVIGTEGVYIGSPSFMPINSISVANMGAIGDLGDEYEFGLSNETFTFDRQINEYYLDGGDQVSAYLPLRTPSTVVVTPSSDVVIQIRQSYTGEFVDHQTLVGGTTYTLTSSDVNYIRFKTTAPNQTTINVSISWDSQIGFYLLSSEPILSAA